MEEKDEIDNDNEINDNEIIINDNEIKNNDNEIIINDNEIKNNDNEIKNNDNKIKNNNEKILSILFNEYQKSLQIEEDKEKGPNLDEKKRRNTINDLKIKNEEVFSKIVIKKFDDIKNNFISKCNISIEKYKKNYETYKNNILKYMKLKEDNLSKIIKNDNKNEEILKYAINNIFNKINNIINIYDNIMINIEDNFELLNNYLEKNELIKPKKPIDFFLNKYYENISNCSLLNKFDFNKIDTKNIFQNNYYKNYFNYIKEDKNNGLIKTYTINQCELKKRIPFINENFNWIQNLQLKGFQCNDLEKIMEPILTNINKNKNHNLKKLSIKDFDFSGGIEVTKLHQIKLNKIQKLKLISGKYLNPFFLKDLFLKTTECLTILELEKVNMSNIGLKALMNIFKEKPIFLETLEYLSLAGNSISSVKNDIFNNEKMSNKVFKKLKIFNLQKNNIYKYELGLEKFPQMKLLDLSSNNILTATIMDNMIKEKNKLILFNDNLFITNNLNNNMRYIEYLNKSMPTLDFGLKVLHLGFTYDKEKEKLLEKLQLSPSIKISLIKLDLSFCGITTKVFVNFLKNNFGLFSLKNLKLKYNNFDSSIFKNLLSEDILLENLKTIDLSENVIPLKEFEDNKSLVEFIKKYKNLEQLKLMNSEFIDRWTVNISPDTDTEGQFRNLYISFKEEMKKDNRQFIFIIDSSNWSFVEKEFEHLFNFRQ